MPINVKDNSHCCDVLRSLSLLLCSPCAERHFALMSTFLHRFHVKLILHTKFAQLTWNYTNLKSSCWNDKNAHHCCTGA